MKRRLPLQAAILAVCVATVGLWAWHFPYPSPLIKPFLPPELRWPTLQVWEWAKSGDADPAFLAFFLRDPERTIPAGHNVVAPVDGTVLGIHEHDGMRYVIISLNVWDVHVARSPVPGTVTTVTEGGVSDGTRNVPLYWLQDKLAPVYKRVELATPDGPVALYLVTSALSQRIVLDVGVDDVVEKGQRIGRMLFGSTAVLGVPDRLHFLIDVGDRVVAGESVIVDLNGAEGG